MDGPSVVMTSGLTKRYGDHLVLRGVDLEVHQGEVFCLLGPNGAGKTTTVEILEGFREATDGTVRVLGFDPADQLQELRRRIGVVLQECGFAKHLRVNEMVDAWRSYYPDPLSRHEVLDIVELGEQEATLVRHLSGGQRRRLDFALALVGDPELIFLDEPTTGFDPEARRRCWEAVENLATLGKTVLLTTHYLDEAERLSDRIGILSAGRLGHVGSVRELAHQVGAPVRIAFSVPDDTSTASLPPLVADRVTIENGRASLRVDRPTPALRSILDWADKQGLDGLAELEVAPPTLEDIYLQLLDDPDSL